MMDESGKHDGNVANIKKKACQIMGLSVAGILGQTSLLLIISILLQCGRCLRHYFLGNVCMITWAIMILSSVSTFLTWLVAKRPNKYRTTFIFVFQLGVLSLGMSLLFMEFAGTGVDNGKHNHRDYNPDEDFNYGDDLQSASVVFIIVPLINIIALILAFIKGLGLFMAGHDEFKSKPVSFAYSVKL